MLDTVFQLDDEGWRKLTFRWGVFFFVLAALNEVVWRTQTTDFWVNFKVFGIMPLTLVFALAQTPLILRHELKDAKDGSPVIGSAATKQPRRRRNACRASSHGARAVQHAPSAAAIASGGPGIDWR